MTPDPVTWASISPYTDCRNGSSREAIFSPTGLIANAIGDGDAHRRDSRSPEGDLVVSMRSQWCITRGDRRSNTYTKEFTMAEVETLTRALVAALDARDELTEEVAQLRAQCCTLTEELNRHRVEHLAAA